MLPIYVVNNYGQFNHLILRMLRDLDIGARMIPNTTPAEEVANECRGLILGGGPTLSRAGNGEAYLALGIPELGICLGLHIIATRFGGTVTPGHAGGYGPVEVDVVFRDESTTRSAPDETLKCASLDTFADYGKRFEESESVDGVADTVAQPLKGDFNQLLKLEKNHPELRVLISLGGWTQSSRFSDAALPASRAAFVASCVDMFVRGKFAAGIVAPGVFDGIDLDWEYPGSCGATCNFRTDDAVNFPALPGGIPPPAGHSRGRGPGRDRQASGIPAVHCGSGGRRALRADRPRRDP